jgi:hypothetical protein
VREASSADDTLFNFTDNLMKDRIKNERKFFQSKPEGFDSKLSSAAHAELLKNHLAMRDADIIPSLLRVLMWSDEKTELYIKSTVDPKFLPAQNDKETLLPKVEAKIESMEEKFKKNFVGGDEY